MTRVAALLRVLAVVAWMAVLLLLSEGEASADCTESLQAGAEASADPCGGQSTVVGAAVVLGGAALGTAAAVGAQVAGSLKGAQPAADLRTHQDSLGEAAGEGGASGEGSDRGSGDGPPGDTRTREPAATPATSGPYPEFAIARRLTELLAEDEAGIRYAAGVIADFAAAAVGAAETAVGAPAAAEVAVLATRMTDLADRIARAPETSTRLRDELAAALIRLAGLRSPLGGPAGLATGPATPTRPAGYNAPGEFFLGSFKAIRSRATVKKLENTWKRYDSETKTWVSWIEEVFPPTYRRVPLRSFVQHQIFANASRNAKNEFVCALDPTKTIPPERDRYGRIVRYHRDTGKRLKKGDPGYTTDWIPHPQPGTRGKQAEYVFGHKPLHEWRTYQFTAYLRGYSRTRIIEEQNDPEIYQLEYRHSNHAHEVMFEAAYEPYVP
ncbi:hypothetical protein ACWEVP_21485 [Amycolatopsis sp. NPDC003865]